MIKKTNLSDSQIVTNGKKQVSIPHDFEPVSRRKQDEEKDVLFNNMGDSQNAKFSAQRFEDDESDDSYHEKDDVATEDVLSEVDDRSTNE